MGFNAKLFEVVLYADSYDFGVLESDLSKRSGVRDYAYIVHDQCAGKDGKPLKAHAHVMLRMNNAYNSDNVAKWFEASPSQVEKCKGRWADMLAYLTHANAPKKFQYDPALVVSNFDWLSESQKAGKKNGDARLTEIVELIVSGVCREFNYTEYIEQDEYIRYETQINRAYKYRIDKIKRLERDMNVIYICGESGAGKTTYAKLLADERGFVPFIAGSSNDPLDGYRGEDCLILDDLRASCMSISDLLKLLDNHTGSLVKSRYKNKFLECQLVIITSIQTIDHLYSMFAEQDEPLEQLKRRCGTYIEMTQDEIVVRVWDKKNRRYSKPTYLPNFVLRLLATEELTDSDIEETVSGLVGSHRGLVAEMEAEKKTPNGSRPWLDAAEDLFGAVKVPSDKVPF